MGDQGVSETTSAVFLRTSFSGTNTFEITDLSKMRLTLDLKLIGAISLYVEPVDLRCFNNISSFDDISSSVSTSVLAGVSCSGCKWR